MCDYVWARTQMISFLLTYVFVRYILCVRLCTFLLHVSLLNFLVWHKTTDRFLQDFIYQNKHSGNYQSIFQTWYNWPLMIRQKKEPVLSTWSVSKHILLSRYRFTMAQGTVRIELATLANSMRQFAKYQFTVGDRCRYMSNYFVWKILFVLSSLLLVREWNPIRDINGRNVRPPSQVYTKPPAFNSHGQLKSWAYSSIPLVLPQ